MGDSVESESGTIDRSLASYALKNLLYRRDALLPPLLST
jgi:hypothetical protein